MDEFNPYAAPKAEISIGPHASDGPGVSRDGPLLVMTKDEELPDRCLKCNLPGNRPKLKRNLRWHPPLVYLLLLINVILYLIVALIAQKTATVWVPLCEEHRRRRHRAIVVGWLASLLGIAAIAGAVTSTVIPFAASIEDYAAPAMLLTGMGLLFGGIIYGVLGSQVTVPHKIDKRFVWLKKAHPEFLAELPPWTS